MKKYLTLILFVATLATSCTRGVKKNPDTKYIDFINSFKNETKLDIIDFRRTINNKSLMSKEEALSFVYHTNDTTKLYCVEFDYRNEDEVFLGVSGTFLQMPNKCLKIDMGDYYFIAYNSYQCTNTIENCPDPNNLRDCFLNEEFRVFLTLCIVDNGFNLRDSMLVCKSNDFESFIKGLLNPQNGKIFINEENKALIYEVDKNLNFLIVKEEITNKGSDDLMRTLKDLDWEQSFLE